MSSAGFPKVGQMAPLGHDRYSEGHKQQKGQRGAWAVKDPRGPWGYNLKLALDILDMLMKSKKKKVLGVFSGIF